MKDMLWDEILEGPDFTAIRDLIESFCDVIEDHTDDEGNILFEVEVFNMPSSVKGGRGRSSIPMYRVKEGRKRGEVSSSFKKIDCTEFIREHQKEYRGKLRLIEPNY